MDFDHVYKGLEGRIHQWRAVHWVFWSRVVAHVDLWQAIMAVLQHTKPPAKCLWVQSHAGIQGNDHVDALADYRRELSPLLKAVRDSVKTQATKFKA